MSTLLGVSTEVRTRRTGGQQDGFGGGGVVPLGKSFKGKRGTGELIIHQSVVNKDVHRVRGKKNASQLKKNQVGLEGGEGHLKVPTMGESQLL